jgi:hypothetical protein
MPLRLRKGLLRRAVLERSLSLLATGRKAFILMRRSDALPVCRGQRIPDARDAVTGANADQASAAVPSIKCRKGRPLRAAPLLSFGLVVLGCDLGNQLCKLCR